MTTVRICRNISCLLVMPQSDEDSLAQYPESEEKCPRCGTPWKGPPYWKGPGPYAVDMEGKETQE